MKKPDIKFMILMGILGVIVIGGLYQMFVSPVLTSHYLNKETRYAITSSIGFVKAGHFGRYAHDYYFSIREAEYTRKYHSFNLERQHYFVKFYPPHPRYNQITNIEATEEEIDRMPPNGDKELQHQ